jgi:virginiamycin B lyase
MNENMQVKRNQGDRQGRPYPIRAAWTFVYGRGDPGGRSGFLLSLLLCIAFLLAACGDAFTPTQPVGPIDSPAVSAQQTVTASVTATGTFREYALPQTNSGLMRPAIDREGRIWFGEMGHNYLAVFDPRTGVFQQLTPPHGMYGIMGVEVAADDTIWYAEQYANYIGHFSPATHHYQVYQLPDVAAPDPSNPGKTVTLPAAPNDIAIDAHGNIWFTEQNANAIGRLDPQTGAIRQFSLATSSSAQSLNPYGIAIDPHGRVWFTEASTSTIGMLDPTTGAQHVYPLPGLSTGLMEIASDPHGTIWVTSFNAGLLLSLNPQTGAITRYYAPAPGGNAGGLYGLTITPNGEIWVTLSALSIIARLDVAADRFIYYSIPTSDSLPLGIVSGAHNTFWFTEAGSDRIGMLQPS